MTTESPAAGGGPRGLRAIVYEALPPGATPTDTASHPIPGNVLAKAQGDVVELTRQKMSTELGEAPHVVVVLREGDLDPATDADVLRVVEQTDGGVLVFGVTYTLDEAGPEIREPCPECGGMSAFEISGGASPAGGARAHVLLECRECGAVWDA
jgi:hypothetical protein